MLVQFSCSVMSDSLRPHGLQHTRLPCPLPAPGAYSNSSPSSWKCHPTTSSSGIPFSSSPQSFPVKGCCWTMKDAGILGLWRRRLHSRARDKPWSLRAEIDAFLELSCFFGDPADVGNLISGSSAFSKTSLNIWKFTVHVLLKAGLGEFWALLY